ncbi:MAG: nucleotidyltransferase domain-containing protein [Lachnospiraceae bacterium]|nr:nucleotidyltransferase domain-containing protein [Lachnospiraceae bacterium]
MDRWKTFKEIEMDKDRTFNVIDKQYSSVLNINKIHPLKQDKIYRLVTGTDMGSIKRVWIFGSSTNNSCNIHSDIDVLVELKDQDNPDQEEVICQIHKRFAKVLGTDFDLILTNELDKNKQFYENILKTRRLVYECPD